MIYLKNLGKSYILKSGKKYEALKNINLKCKYGEFISIVGRSGAGKTSLLNVIGGLDTFDKGTFYLDGIDVTSFCENEWNTYRNVKVGFIFQHYNLINHLTVYENVEIVLILNSYCKEGRKKLVLDVLKKVGLEKQINKKPGFLSGGEQQRVAIARAIVNNPDIILADEPTGQLDKKTAKQILDLIKEVCKEKLVIVVTHMEQLIKNYATRIIRLSDGMIKEDKTVVEVAAKKVVAKENKKIKFKAALFLGMRNLRQKWISSLTLFFICTIILSLVMTSLIIANKDIKNDIYRVTANRTPMNLIEISKSDNSDFNHSEINRIKRIENVQSVIPIYKELINYLINNEFSSINYELLPDKEKDFYLHEALVCGNYPAENEVLLDIKMAINLVDDTEKSLYSRYDMNMISDEDIWEKLKGQSLKLINGKGETLNYPISGIVNKSVWDYSNIDIYLIKNDLIKIIGDNKPIKNLKIYLSNFDEKTRNETIHIIDSLDDNYYFNLTINDEVNNVYENLNDIINIVKAFTQILTVVSIISVIALINYTVHTRIKEVGIMKSLGASTNDIKIMFTSEYLLITSISILASYLVGMLLTNLFIRSSSVAYTKNRISVGYHFVWPNLILYLTVSFGGLLVILLSSLIPIHKTAKLPVVDIIREKK